MTLLVTLVTVRRNKAAGRLADPDALPGTQVYAVEAGHSQGHALRAMALHVPIFDRDGAASSSAQGQHAFPPEAADRALSEEMTARHKSKASKYCLSVVSVAVVPPDRNRGVSLSSAQHAPP